MNLRNLMNVGGRTSLNEYTVKTCVNRQGKWNVHLDWYIMPLGSVKQGVNIDTFYFSCHLDHDSGQRDTDDKCRMLQSGKQFFLP